MNTNEDTVIYLPLNPERRGIAGIYDYGARRAINFAFTSADKGKAFLKKAREVGIPGFAEIDALVPSTVGEFFRWKEEGKIVGELVIDHPPEKLDHPVYTRSADIQN